KVPFAALPLSHDTVLDRFSVRLDFSWQPRTRSMPTRGSAFIAAVSQGGEGRSVLEHAKSEASWVKNWCSDHGYDPVVQLDSEQVTRQSLAQALTQATLFHFAGHGGFEAQRGAGSGLVLHNTGEQFTFADIAALPETSLRLVMLMACHG